jgi:uncharacterized peroxidase-related enzyme
MAWIETVPYERAEGPLREAYEAAIRAGAGRGGLVEAQSLLPDAMRHAFLALAALLAPDLPLDRREREMVMTVVSAANKCHVCLARHTGALRRLSKDEALVEALRADYRQADLAPRERAMLDYAWRLTVSPGAVREADIARLREHGFDDRAIAQLAQLTAWLNYLNRVADGLGAARAGEED